jgi:hypothetical protein
MSQRESGFSKISSITGLVVLAVLTLPPFIKAGLFILIGLLFGGPIHDPLDVLFSLLTLAALCAPFVISVVLYGTKRYVVSLILSILAAVLIVFVCYYVPTTVWYQSFNDVPNWPTWVGILHLLAI